MSYYVEIPEENRVFVAAQIRAVAKWYDKKVIHGTCEVDSKLVLIDNDSIFFSADHIERQDGKYKRMELTDLLTKGLPKVVDYSKWVGLPVWVWDNEDEEEYPSLEFFKEYDSDRECRFVTNESVGDNEYFYAKLVTKEELLEWADRVGGVDGKERL